MTTSEVPYSLTFFKKRECLPCQHAEDNLKAVLELHPEYQQYVTVLQKEDHPQLVSAYDLNLYPTVLIQDMQSAEIARKIGVRFLSQEWWDAALSAIHLNHGKDL